MIFKSLEFKVGFLVIGGLVLISSLIMLITDKKGVFFKGVKTLWFNVDNASGLISNGRVKVSGIPVGFIEEIKLAGNQAQVFVKLKSDLPLTTSSEVQVVSYQPDKKKWQCI